MDLSLRLQKVTDLVPVCECIADIGTDHGFALISLLKNNKIKFGIASDNKAMPLEKAKVNARYEGYFDQIEFRLGSGFETLKPGEVSGAIVAGMGGILITELIETSLELVKSLDFLLLQPAQNPEILRSFLYESNFEILDEELVKEESRFYEYFLVKYSSSKNKIHQNICGYIVGESLIEKRHPLLLEFIEMKIAELEKISEKITSPTENAKVKMDYLYHKMNELRRVRDEYLC